MAVYNEIRGLRVKYLSADPSNAEDGQVWYNSTSGNLRVQGIGTGAWISSTSLSEARRLGGGFGITSAAITFGGFGPPDNKTTSEEYNGSGWTSGGALNNGTARFAGSVGTLTAGLTAGGLSTPTVYQNSAEEYNGTAWTSVTNLPVARGAGSTGGIGIQTAAIIAVGGTGIPTTADAATLKYDGTNWTAGGSMNTARVYTAGFGTQTAGLYMGGAPGTKANVELYDGTSWSETTDMNTGRYSLVTSNNSPQTSGIGASGYAAPGLSVATESWDGSSWTNQSNMATARNAATGAGASSSSVMVSGGQTPTQSKAVEEYNFSTDTFTAGAWSSGASLGQVRRVGAGTGPQTAGMVFGGFDASTALGQTEQYNGTSWTEVGDLTTARGKLGSATAGSQTATLGFGGSTAEPSNPAIVDNSEEFNGSSWSEGNNINTARYNIAGAGTQTAGLGFGGYTTGTNRNESEEYNGTSWTEGNNLNTARGYIAGGGIQTAALAATGFIDGGGGNTAITEEYDGTSWTTVTVCPTAQASAILSGTQTNAIIFAGSPNRATTFGYDGTNWSTRPSMATGRDFASGFGTTGTTGLCAGGNGGTPGDEGIGTVEEFNGATTTAGGASNLTTS